MFNQLPLHYPAEPVLFLERPRVDSLLERSLSSYLVTIIAGEGYGKTQAVHSFLRKRDEGVIWVQLSERDNLGLHFWENFTGALGLINPEMGRITASFGFPDGGGEFERYTNFLTDEIPPEEKIVVVLDDFHLIHAPPVLRFFERNFSYPLRNNAIFLISRTEPALNMIPFLSKGWLSGLTTDDLRFSEEEVARYFELHGIAMSNDELARVYNDTEGWALAVDLLMRDIKSTGSSSYTWQNLSSSSWRKIEDRIFGSMEAGLRKFFIKLSLLEHWSQELLEKLDPEGGYIDAMEGFSALSRYDVYLHGYRLHHLFLEFLREKQDELDREEIREVYLLGARWCMANRLPTDAAVYYEKAGDYRGIITVLYTFPHFLPRRVAAFFLELISRIYPPVGKNPDFTHLWFVSRPRLLIFLGRFDESRVECGKSIEYFEALPLNSGNARILAYCYSTLGILSIAACRFTGNYDFLPYFEKADYYNSMNEEPVQDPGVKCNIGAYAMQVGFPAEKGEYERLMKSFVPAIVHAVHTGNGYLYGMDALSWAELFYYRGDLTGAEQFARKAVFMGREREQYEVENHGLFLLLRTTLHTGNLPDLKEILRQLEAQLEIEEYINRFIYHDIITGWYCLQTGEPEKLASWLKNDIEEDELNTIFPSIDILVKAKYALMKNQHEKAINILRRGEGKNGIGSYLLGKIELRLLEGTAVYRLGKKEEAFEALEAAWEMASPNGIDMPFIELGEDMRLIAGDYLAERREGEKSVPRSWLETIRNKASVYGKKLARLQYGDGEQEGSGGIYLFRRERDILEGLSRGQSREEIAGKTGLSLNSVKTMIRSIYAKLGAVNRADAVRIATQAGLLPAGEKRNISQM
jgi:LuxR family maltose regulon positive regulatory protein